MDDTTKGCINFLVSFVVVVVSFATAMAVTTSFDEYIMSILSWDTYYFYGKIIVHPVFVAVFVGVIFVFITLYCKFFPEEEEEDF